MRLQNQNYFRMEQLQEQYLNPSKKQINPENTSEISFQSILKLKSEQEQKANDVSLKFSRHAMSRLTNRQIELTNGQVERLNEGAKKAEEKGIRESLVLVDQLAFIVNIPNNTVVTAMDSKQTDENIFTNIDGAVIV